MGGDNAIFISGIDRVYNFSVEWLTMRSQLTSSQQRVYSFLVGFIRENGFPPTIREIQKNFNYNSSNSVVVQLANLGKKGYVTKASSKDGMKARTLRIVDDIIGIHTIEASQLKNAIGNMAKKKYTMKLNEAVELLGELKIKIV